MWQRVPAKEIWAGESGSEASGEALGRSRGGFTTKLHVVCDGNGVPLGAAISPGQTHESKCFETVLSSVLVPGLPKALAGDKGYGVARIRDWLATRSVEDVIPYKVTEHPPEGTEFNREAYRRRNVVERLIGWLKECRRVAMRYEKRGRHFLAMIKVAMIRRLVRVRA